METQGLLEVDHHHPKEEWKSVTTTSGALSVMTHGIVWMPVLLVCNLAIALKVHRKLYYHIVMIINNNIIIMKRCNCSKISCVRTRNWTYSTRSSSLYWK